MGRSRSSGRHQPQRRGEQPGGDRRQAEGQIAFGAQLYLAMLLVFVALSTIATRWPAPAYGRTEPTCSVGTNR
jgi:hypothetical protein